MNIAVFVTVWSTAIPATALSKHMLADPLTYLKNVTGVERVEIYTPAAADIPPFDDIPMPTIIVQVDLDSEEHAKDMLKTTEFNGLFLDKQAFAGAVDKINMELFEAVHYPIAGEDTPAPRTAPLSFVVRYYGPVKDMQHFIHFYTENHPPILARFPGIRNVLCYLPLGWKETGELTDETILIGNEVVFDDAESFMAALATDVLAEAMADSEQFIPYGYSSHHAMHREKVYQK